MPHDFTHDERKRSRDAATANARANHEAIAQEIVRLARAGTLEPTLTKIAEQLNHAGIRTTRGTEFNRVKLSLALDAMGVNAADVKRWRRSAERASSKLDVPLVMMLHQLMDQWFHHRSSEPFVPTFTHPRDYTMVAERSGFPDNTPIASPRLRVTVALMGFLDPLDEGGLDYRSRDANGEPNPLWHRTPRTK